MNAGDRAALRELGSRLSAGTAQPAAAMTYAAARPSAARLAERSKAASVSDGRSEVLDAFNARYEPMQADCIRVDTSRGIGAETLSELSRA